MKKYILEVAVFVCGAVVMIYELVGSRILAPYLGSSIYVWTSLIGVILGSLSLGYWLGGRLSDKKASMETLSLIIFISSILIFTVVLTKDIILPPFGKMISQMELATFLSSCLLFAPASILFGMVSPYAVKLKMRDLKKSGRTVGNLYALSTLGSIVGTFLAGFFLIPYFGSAGITVIMAIILAALSFILSPRYFLVPKVTALVLLVAFMVVRPYLAAAQEKATGIIDIDTKYNFVRIYPSTDDITKRKTLNLMFDPTGIQSGVFLEGPDDLVYDYTKYYRLAGIFNPSISDGLLIGGAAYTVPRDFLRMYPDAKMDVVEIDDQLADIARKYFRLKDDPRLTIFNEDGRTYLNRNVKKYDVIFMDAFQSLLTTPYHLTTTEAVREMYDSLNDNGVLMTNVIAAIDGDKGKFLRAEYATYKSVFPQVFLFNIRMGDSDKSQNLMLVGLKSSIPPTLKSNDIILDSYLKRLWTKQIADDMPVLTDDYAPVDFYTRQSF